MCKAIRGHQLILPSKGAATVGSRAPAMRICLWCESVSPPETFFAVCFYCVLGRQTLAWIVDKPQVATFVWELGVIGFDPRCYRIELILSCSGSWKALYVDENTSQWIFGENLQARLGRLNTNIFTQILEHDFPHTMMVHQLAVKVPNICRNCKNCTLL